MKITGWYTLKNQNQGQMWSEKLGYKAWAVNARYVSFTSSPKVRKDRGTQNGWHEIDWREVEVKIKNLQAKIVTATLNNNMLETYRLQWQILKSFEGKALAVRKVVTNRGGRTTGIDNIKWEGPQDYWKAISEMESIIRDIKNYHAQPVRRRVYIPKPNTTDKRPLGIPTMIDRAIQAIYQFGIDPIVETRSDPNSFGFRKNRSTHDAVTAIRSILDKETHPRWILEVDIKKCFERIDHEFLMKHTPICHKAMLEKWLKAGIMEEMNYSDTTEGTPQGGIISPVLCNVAMNGLEEEIKKANPLIKGISQGVHIIRYADDMIVTSRTPEIAERNKNLISEFLKVRGLELHPDKTKITNIKEGFDFLGFNFKRMPYNRKYNKETEQSTVLIIKPSDKGVKKLKATVKGIIRPDMKIENIIREANPVLRGWAEHKRISYHSQAIFIKIDYWIYLRMMRWARAQSTKIGLKETLKKYLFETETRKWNWGIKKEKLNLINIAEIPIITLRPLKLNKNPYKLEDIVYFNKRRENLVEAKFKLAIFKKHKHLCPGCGESLHNGEPIELHHIISKRSRGKYTMSNIQPLHRICHQQITNTERNT